MREELALLHEQNERIRKACQSQRKNLQLQRIHLKIQRGNLLREAERLRQMQQIPTKLPARPSH